MNIKKDLETFDEIFTALRQDEIENPVSKVFEAQTLFETLDLSLRDDPISDDTFKAILKELVLKTPKTSSNRFFNQLFGGRQSRAVLGDLLAVVMNTSMYTYKVGGAQIGVEKEIIKQIISKIGYGEGSGGTFPTGGSLSNFMAMIMARDHFNADIKHKGMQQTLIAYTSTESHYSIDKNAAFAGIGRDNIRYIRTNFRGEMQVEALDKQIKEDLSKGLQPFFVNATAGTTVLGSTDPLNEIAAVCQQYKLWFHVDAALGGAVMFSEKYKYLLKGSEYSDSFAFNAHKMIGVPLSCSMIVVQDKRKLYQSFSNEADYLYQGDDDDLNLGKMSLQCGRRNDALKFWTLWKSIGTKGLEQIVDHQFELANKAHDYVSSHPDYIVYSHPPSISICFNYKNIDPKLLCAALLEEQEIMVGYGALADTTFVRLIAVNSNNSVEEFLEFFNILENFVERKGDELVK